MRCDATGSDPAALTEALNDEYDRDEGEPDGALVWFEHVITHGMQRIRAHLELSGDELHVHANSEARFERVLATIRALDPSVTVLRETREPAGDVRAVQRLAARSSATPATFLDPAANPAIVQRWTDDHVPRAGDPQPRPHRQRPQAPACGNRFP